MYHISYVDTEVFNVIHKKKQRIQKHLLCPAPVIAARSELLKSQEAGKRGDWIKGTVLGPGSPQEKGNRENEKKCRLWRSQNPNIEDLLQI